MDSKDLPLILRCGQCNKPFDKEASLKRHGYYCRSKRGEIRTGLPRSCSACARAKVRCDKKAPRCTRCKDKKGACYYPANGARDPELEHQQIRHRNADQSTAPDTPCSSQKTVECDATLCLEGTNAASDFLALPGLGNYAFDWDIPDVNHTQYLHFNDTRINQPNPSNAASTLTKPNSASVPDSMANSHLVTYAPIANTDIQIPPALAFGIRALWTRPKLETGAHITANHMTNILNSYPQMILNYDALPPFIHPQWASASGTEKFLEPLANCINLARMLAAGGQGSGRLFWRSVRMECDRLCSIHHTLSKFGLLAAIQALLMYVLIRLAEGETEVNNHDDTLLHTLTLLLTGLGTKVPCLPLDLVNQEQSWDVWIFEESRRRMGAVFRIINMLVCVEPAMICQSQPGLILAPLPARKQLWEAGSEEQWMQERKRKMEANSGFGLAMNGDLVTLDEYQMKLLSMNSGEPWASEKSKENWQDWCAGMDGFGALIMLAASLPT